MKRMIVGAVLCLSLSLIGLLVYPLATSVFAECAGSAELEPDPNDPTRCVESTASTTGTAGPDCKAVDVNFLSFPTWYRGLDCETTVGDGQHINIAKDSSVSTIIFTVALNILDMALRITGIVAVFYIIYGGFIFITAQGDPQRAGQGREAITRALIGVVIAIAASAAVSFIVAGLPSA
jgi:hypothetical protein